MSAELASYCVYTIRVPEQLLDASRHGTPLHESKRWVRAAQLWASARQAGQEMAILFADARHCSELIAWAVLRSVDVAENGTRYTIGQLWGVPRSRPQDLELLDRPARIKKNHIRPYVLCKTPTFLPATLAAAKPWSRENHTKLEVREGRKLLVQHLRSERNVSLIRQLKRQRMAANAGHLPCELCGFDFLERYGSLGAGFAEAHHKTSLSKAPQGGVRTTFSDLAIVCSNCHRMLHQADCPSFQSFRARMRRAMRKRSEAATFGSRGCQVLRTTRTTRLEDDMRQ